MAKKRMSAPSARKEGTLGGFTIIEVVLVLAIAGLIFLMVFIALPALQRSQRDTQRRQDLGRMTDYITQYQTNNNGRLPNVGSLPSVDEDTNGQVLKDASEYSGCFTSTSGVSSSNSACRLLWSYINSVTADENDYKDPLGMAYGINIMDMPDQDEYSGPTDFGAHVIDIVRKARCNGEVAVPSDNARDYAVMYQLESAGMYCQDNGS